MWNRDDKLLATASICGLVTLGMGLTGKAFLFSLGITLLICFGFAASYGSHATHLRIAIPLIITLISFWGLFAGIFQNHKPDDPVKLVLGLPVGSSLLVFGMWPLGLLPTALLTILFKRSILPCESVEKLVARFGRWDPDR